MEKKIDKSQLSEKGKKIMFGLILILICSPIILMRINISNPIENKSEMTENKDPEFSLKSYLSGVYQKDKEKYINNHFRGRTLLIKLHNQIDYSLFNKLNARDIIEGKDGYFYELNYIKAYLGLDFLGESEINSKVEKLKAVQDTLEKLNKKLIVVFAAGKGTFFPEYIPQKFLSQKTDKTNYAYYRSALTNKNINFVDFNSWFVQMKNHTKYPLFPKAGIHWSAYGEFLAADSIRNYVANITNREMPKFILEKVVWSTKNIQNDYDIGAGLNLIFDLPTYPMGYPQFKISNSELKSGKTPKVLVIGDSFYWGMYNFGMSDKVLGNGQFWFYNQQVYPDSFVNPITVNDVDFQSKMDENDAIILMCTDANLPRFAFGFIDRIYNFYFDTNANLLEDNIVNMMNIIRRTPEWIQSIENQAREHGQPLEKVLRENAIYVIEEEKKKSNN